ncbi:hypothetical protein A2164_02810 [Candidatus Curtissbacteria bacterium RBG_13_35_7]|uniref:Uncharacterized protein n=1 Tax=Candidatus Curtissbacteria bacterium RBG_13_35_7 TaxID=1797705 RepID=A0A1F5G2E0_9BACT|nr:MAG: hypothetical protein A2164_02810 [Candidatus Curtissbacteria bacterium RBG_13_35_7]
MIPAVYFLFYNRFDPHTIQDKIARWINEPSSYRQVYIEIENIESRRISWEEDKNLEKSLLIGYPKEFLDKDI